MEPVILDTDVLSFIAKGDTRAALYAADLVGHPLAVCFQTIAELRLWAIRREWGAAKQSHLQRLLDQMAVFSFDVLTAQRWADVTAYRSRIGRPIECGDAWIAATALRHDLLLVSHNGRDYADIPGLKLVCYA